MQNTFCITRFEIQPKPWPELSTGLKEASDYTSRTDGLMTGGHMEASSRTENHWSLNKVMKRTGLVGWSQATSQGEGEN